MAIHIDNSTVSDSSWGEVDRAALARRLPEAGEAKAIREAFTYVPDLENRSEWGGPHHELPGSPASGGQALVVNRNGVHALAAARKGVVDPQAAYLLGTQPRPR
jgi:hypothetical protein